MNHHTLTITNYQALILGHCLQQRIVQLRERCARNDRQAFGLLDECNQIMAVLKPAIEVEEERRVAA